MSSSSSELLRVFEERDLRARSERRYPDSLIDQHNALLDRIGEPVGETEDARRADMARHFGDYLDLMVRNKSFVDSDPDYKEDMRQILLDMHANPSQRAMLPPFDWHFWQLFRQRLPKVTKDAPKVETPPQATQYADAMSCTNPFLHVPTFSEFVLFVIQFVRQEFGEDRVFPVSGATRFDAQGLCFDEVAYVNLATAIETDYPDMVQMAFEGARHIPDAFFNAFGGDPTFTVGDLYDELAD